MRATSPALSVKSAVEILDRLLQAAPPATSIKLGQIIALIQSLAEETAYLNSILAEDSSVLKKMGNLAEIDSAPVRTASAPFPQNEAIADDTSAMDLLVGMNDALRAPLVAIRGRSELIQAGLLGQITAEQGQWLNAIHENTGRAFGLLDALQQIVALHKEQVKVDWSSFIASDLLEEAYERVRDRAADLKHNLTTQVPESVPMAQGDFYQALMILTDLLDNAIRYTPPGGSIRLSIDNLGTHVLFSVADNGIGLSPEDSAHVGKPFWRGEHHRLVRHHPGTGLTLFLARRLLALQQGELIFYGEPDLGSTFSFTLMIAS